MEKLYPIGWTFCSHIQLFQVASMFAGYWTFEVTWSGCAIQCHFSKPTYQTKCSTTKKIGKTKESLKVSIKCPFNIGYNVIGQNWQKRKKTQSKDTTDYDVTTLPKAYYHV